ncbi:hypothetical protein B0T25DRAFT_554227 [Lasiosphaeria hispida]|uniref:F-box domain-containing protein n=1 Tax=Lasiosphaeria hispida TaxID=260671 RepID=A0AAJ0H8K8_9PEZI|nr:hypothetical protein B0T25DRAFT_554227 [Lasiosphaeria hispida]
MKEVASRSTQRKPPVARTIIFTDDGDGDGSDDDVLVDMTQALAVDSKRTKRLRKRQEKKASKSSLVGARGFLDLPYEILIEILGILHPRDLVVLSWVNRPLRHFMFAEEDHITETVIATRYVAIAKCFPRPVLLEHVDPAFRSALQNPLRSKPQPLHQRPFQHIQPPDPSVVCTCLTCILRWNSLCLALDFAHWQDNLDKGEPIPMIPRGTCPQWNQQLISRHADNVTRSLTRPLWYAMILEAHLDSTIRSIRRHSLNKGNRRRRFRMTDEDIRAGTDAFLERSGPPTVDTPYHRDNYYMLEAYLPNRSWIADRGRWVYVPADQHDRDVQIAVRWAPSR